MGLLFDWKQTNNLFVLLVSQGAFHKTKLCPAVESGMQCNKGDTCSYAHSKEELREPPNLKKTKLCQLFEMSRVKSNYLNRLS